MWLISAATFLLVGPSYDWNCSALMVQISFFLMPWQLCLVFLHGIKWDKLVPAKKTWYPCRTAALWYLWVCDHMWGSLHFTIHMFAARLISFFMHEMITRSWHIDPSWSSRTDGIHRENVKASAYGKYHNFVLAHIARTPYSMIWFFMFTYMQRIRTCYKTRFLLLLEYASTNFASLGASLGVWQFEVQSAN